MRYWGRTHIRNNGDLWIWNFVRDYVFNLSSEVEISRVISFTLMLLLIKKFYWHFHVILSLAIFFNSTVCDATVVLHNLSGNITDVCNTLSLPMPISANLPSTTNLTSNNFQQEKHPPFAVHEFRCLVSSISFGRPISRSTSSGESTPSVPVNRKVSTDPYS